MQIEDFIERLETLDTDASLQQQRADYESLHRHHRPANPRGLRTRDARVEQVGIRHFVPAGAQAGSVVYFHGGGWNLGSVESHHGITADLAQRLGHEVISVDYRRLPEASYAEALADCRAVVDAFAPVTVIGDSAGGRLAIDVAHTSDWTGVLGVIYPVVGTPTRETLGDDAPLLSQADVLSLWAMASSDIPDIDANIPPAACIEALAVERDPLTRPLEAAVAAWREAGASVGYRSAPDMVHSALHGHAELASMKTAWQDFCQAIRRQLSAD